MLLHYNHCNMRHILLLLHDSITKTCGKFIHNTASLYQTIMKDTVIQDSAGAYQEAEKQMSIGMNKDSDIYSILEFTV